jgi:cysteinyl-tRNA synthetase
VLFSLVRSLNRDPGSGLGAEVRDFLAEVDELFDAFDLRSAGEAAGEGDDARVDELVGKRNELRRARRFAEADEIRSSLAGQGIVIEDTPEGTRWWHAVSSGG